MLKLYLGSVKNIISTGVIAFFFYFVVTTMNKDSAAVNWKTMCAYLLGIGVLLSATSGIKDSNIPKSAISFESLNAPLIILCALGGIAAISGVASFIIKKENVHKIIFYVMSAICVAKIAIVESIRIINYFKK